MAINTVKCCLCGDRVAKSEAFCITTPAGKNNYYCSFEEYSEQQAYLAKIDTVNMTLMGLIGENISYSTIRRLIQKYYEKPQIDRLIRYLNQNIDNLTVSMATGDFNNVYQKTKYLCSIILYNMPYFEEAEQTEYEKKVKTLESLIKEIVGQDVLSLGAVHTKIGAYYLEDKIDKFTSFLQINKDVIINILNEKEFDTVNNKLKYFSGIVMNNLPVWKEGIVINSRIPSPTIVKEVNPSDLGADVSMDDETPKESIVKADIPKIQPKKRPKPLKKKRRSMIEIEEDDD